ncbi:MAG: PKD domain-containing protein, partial [Bacteroidota bacterium]
VAADSAVNASDITWHLGDGTTLTGQNITHTYAQSGVYQIKVYVDDTACVDTLQLSVSAYGPPTGGGCFAHFIALPVWGNAAFFLGNPINSQGINWLQDVVMDYGDGTVDTNFSGFSFHTYAGNGSYQVCMSVTDTSGCSHTYCDSLNVNTNSGGSTTVSGQITYMDNGLTVPAQHAEVYLIQHDQVAQSLTAIDTLTLSPADSGQYSFTGLNADLYFVKAALLPSDSGYASTLPTYYGQTTQWQTSAGIPVGYYWFPFFGIMNDQININLLSGTNPGGPGFVGGLLSNGANKTTFDDVPMENVSVQLYDVQTQELVSHTYSDAQGAFALDDLPYGTYRLHAEVLGRNTLDELVTIGPENPSVDDIDMSLAPQDVTTSRQQLHASAASIIAYPNPTTGELTLSIDGQAPEVLQIELIDLTGRSLLRTDRQVQSGQQQLRLDLEALPSGLYQLYVSGSKTRYTQKIVVQRH